MPRPAPSYLQPTIYQTMRLTLRTLLAYMDDILDPSDQENLSQQVTESEAASELLHRTRDAMRRLRLGAPPILGEGMELDPNLAAEYLDSTMSGDDMSDYQQVCLDSDVHLAEVASCHHILTMVLGEPAEIDPEMRERMYSLPERVEEWHKQRLATPHRIAGAAAAATDAPAPSPARHQSVKQDSAEAEVPDYLRADESSPIGKLALAFAAVFVLGFGAFVLFGPGGVLSSGGDETEVAQAEGDGESPTGDNANSDTNTDTPGDVETGEPAPPSTDGSASPNADTTADTSSTPTTDAANGNTPEENGNSGLPDIQGLGGTTADATTTMADTESPATDGDEGALPAIDVPPLPDTTTPPTDVTVADATTAEAGTDTEPRVAMNTDATPETGSTDSPPEGDGSTDAAGIVPPDPIPLGTTVAPSEVLLQWDDVRSEWLRLPARSSILQGEKLLSLPTYRPALALSGLRVEMSDGSTMTVDFADDGQTLRLEIMYGRFLLHNTDRSPVEVELVIADESKRVVLESAAVLGLEVDRPFISGADVEQSVGEFHAMLYAPSGGLIWDADGQPLEILPPSQWEWHDMVASSLTDDVAWLDGQSLDYLEKNVSIKFEQQFGTERPARVQLLELYETSRRREEKSLASMCATHVGQFVPFVQALADTQQQSNWDEHIAQLRQAMSRSTQAATQVHQTLTEQRGAALADDLFEMLRGYSPEQVGFTPEQVKTGVTRQLIDWLEHNRLEYRVLAIHNLKQIYGGKTLGYNPVVTEPSRQERAVKIWRTRLADNELIPMAAR